MPSGNDGGGSSAPLTKLLAGGVGSITAGLGAFGTLTGGFERVARNEPTAAILLVVVGSLAIGLGVIAPAVSKRVKDGWLGAGTVVLVAVGIIFGVLVIRGASTSERPSVNGSISVTEKTVTVKGLVEASGLKSSEHMLVKVEGEKANVDTVVYVAHVGPNSEGKIKAPVETVVPRDAYSEIIISGQLPKTVGDAAQQEVVQDCGAATRYWGCARLLVPPK